MESVDVAIVGGGPAGSTVAALLAGRGVRVAVIDRDLFPRDKLCGEFLSYDALPVLEPLGIIAQLDRINAPRIDRCRIIGSHRMYEFALARPARGISRFILDNLLLETAVSRGALRLDGWTAATIDTRETRVVVQKDGEQRELSARVIVGAWGRWGRFDKQLGRAFVRDRSHRNFGFKRHYRATAEAKPATSIDLYSFRRGYLGVNAVEGDVTNICGLVHASRLSGHRGGWEAFIETLRREEPRLDSLFASHEPAQQGYLSSEPVIFRARSGVESGVFMAGDASGMIDPLTGNGMAMAIQSALLAAPILLRLVQDPARREELEREYRRTHRRFFTPRIAWSRAVAALLSRPHLLDVALSATRHPAAGELLARRTRGSPDAVARLAERWFC